MDIYEAIVKHIPVGAKTNSRGWTTFNAVCCHHRGHNHDSRSRGNLLFSPNGTIGYNCYNCGFKVIYSPGSLSNKFKTFLEWLSIPKEIIFKLQLQDRDNYKIEDEERIYNLNFPEVKLPEGSELFENLLESNDQNFLKCLEYLSSRGEPILQNYQYYWTPHIPDRIIIPFYYNYKVVGYTGRYFGKPYKKNIPKYLNSNDLPSGFLFNSDQLYSNRKIAVIVEGPFDAIAIDGISALGSTLDKSQVNWLNNSGKQIIIMPDREKNNQNLIDTALENGWFVSFPEWEQGIKDCADASLKYGSVYTLHSIIAAKTSNPLKINVERKRF